MRRSQKLGCLFVIGLVCGIAILHWQGQRQQRTSHGYRVALVTDPCGVDDRSFNQSAWEGVLAYGKANHLKQGLAGYNYFQPHNIGDIKTSLALAAKNDYQLVYGVGYTAAPGITDVAAQYPKIKFAIVDSVVTAPNVVSITFKSEQSSYLAGVAAAKNTRSQTVGFVGGIHGEVIDRFQAGFCAGVRDTNPDIKILVQYTNSFNDAAQGKAIAATMISHHADVIYQAAGGSGSGVFAEAKANNQKFSHGAREKVWVIGVDRDQQADGAYVDSNGVASNLTLVSVVKRVDSAVHNVADRARDGRFPAQQVLSLGLADDGVDLARDQADASTWSAVTAARQQIVAGKIQVPATITTK